MQLDDSTGIACNDAPLTSGSCHLLLILKLEMPLPFARMSFVPTTSLSCVEKSGCQRCVCAHEKTRIEALSGISTTALQLFFCTVCNWMTALALLVRIWMPAYALENEDTGFGT